MKILIEENNESFVKFKLQETYISYANALRRILISEVPTVTIDLVEIEVNNTSLPDEVISHRLGLIPLYIKKDILFRDECSCTDVCQECSVKATLNVSNTGDDPLTVTCKDLKSEDDVIIRSSPIICKLGLRQNLKVKCRAFKGTGQTHSKWSPVSVVEFEYDTGNRSRSTTFWKENNYEEDDKEDEPNLTEEISEVKMCVEVVDGFGSPMVILRKAFEILKGKYERLRLDLVG